MKYLIIKWFMIIIIPVTLFGLGNFTTYYAFIGPSISFYTVLGASVLFMIMLGILLFKYLKWDNIKQEIES
jgi:hypothetical protein